MARSPELAGGNSHRGTMVLMDPKRRGRPRTRGQLGRQRDVRRGEVDTGLPWRQPGRRQRPWVV